MSAAIRAHDAGDEDLKHRVDLSSLLSSNKVYVPPEVPLPLLLSSLRPEHSSVTIRTRPLSAADVALLAHFLSNNKHVVRLSLATVPLGSAVAFQLLAAVAAPREPPSPLRALSLRSVGISTSGAKQIATLIREANFGQLESLDLSNNRANWPGERALEKAVVARVLEGRTAIDVDVSGNLVVVEWLNAITHGLGAFGALAGGIVMTASAVRHGLPGANVASLVVFALSLFTLMASSCVYHSAFRCPAASRRLRKADHCSIFMLIAGSYTPFVVCYTLDPPTFAGPATLLAVWTCASVGIARSLAESGSSNARSLLALATGWLGAFSVRTMTERMQEGALNFVVSGGIAYSLGIIFYLLGKKIPMMHVIWHVAVMLGGGLHYFALWRYVVNG